MKRLLLSTLLAIVGVSFSEAQIKGALQSYNDGKQNVERTQQYFPEGDAFVCENGNNRFTRALYGSHTDWRVETSDRPVFAVVKKNKTWDIVIRMYVLPGDIFKFSFCINENVKHPPRVILCRVIYCNRFIKLIVISAL